MMDDIHKAQELIWRQSGPPEKQMLECVGGPDDGKLRIVNVDTIVIYVPLPMPLVILDAEEELTAAVCMPRRVGKYVRKGWGHGRDADGQSLGWTPILHWEGE